MSARREYVWIHDIAGDQLGVIGRDFRELYTDTTLDQTETLTFEIPAAHPKAYLLTEDVEVRLRGRTFYISEITQERRGTETLIRVEANAAWYRLGENDYIGSLVIDDASPAAGGADILAGTGWTVDDRSSTTGAFSMESQDRSHLANIRTWAKITGTVVEFDTQARTVAWLSQRGADLGLAFRKGRNLRNVVRRRTPPKVTAMFPYGRDNLTIAGVNGGDEFVEDLSFYTAQGLSEDEARERYGKRRVIRDQSFVREADLLAWAQAKLAVEAQSIQSVELDVVDIAEITGVNEALAVGDRCRAFDPDFDEEFAATVTRFRNFPLQPWRNEIELSTSPQIVNDPDASAGRPQLSDEWVQFVGPVRADYQIRNDGSYQVARIPLRFRAGGRADFHLDLWATGVGSGDMIVTVIDTENEDAQQFKQVTVPYTDGEIVRAHLTWAAENLEGRHVYAVRVTTDADGGPSGTLGVNLAADAGIDDIAAGGTYEASFWIKAQGAVQETPVSEDSVRFDYVSDAAQQWTVPDNATVATFTLAAAAGVSDTIPGGGGCRLTFTMAVIPGTTYDIYAPRTGGVGADKAVPGWPGGGTGGDVGGGVADDGGGGGGYAAVIPAGGALAAAVAVAGGGGGAGDQGIVAGGAGGFFQGGSPVNGGQGATQFAGGAGSSSGGSAGSFGQGGTGETSGSSLDEGGGGGGGGWYGGGGGYSGGSEGGAGGGGSGWLDPAVGAFDLTVEDGANTGNGYVEISWEIPI